jgi:hypothetical protein
MYISPETKLPDYVGPKFHVPDSEAQGDTIDINDNLSAAGGDGIIKRQAASTLAVTGVPVGNRQSEQSSLARKPIAARAMREGVTVPPRDLDVLRGMIVIADDSRPGC